MLVAFFRTSKRAKYSRRRPFDEDADIDYINERNMKFNKKLERFYGKYTAEIKQNLERGTAIWALSWHWFWKAHKAARMCCMLMYISVFSVIHRLCSDAQLTIVIHWKQYTEWWCCVTKLLAFWIHSNTFLSVPEIGKTATLAACTVPYLHVCMCKLLAEIGIFVRCTCKHWYRPYTFLIIKFQCCCHLTAFAKAGR